MKLNDYVIYSPNLAGELIDRGFVKKNQRRDYKDPSRWVYFFENTDELRRAVNEISKEVKANDK